LFDPEKGTRKVSKIIIHPEYVHQKRDTNDIALLEVVKPFDFSKPYEVSPICLSSPDVKEQGTSYVSGYGRLFESHEFDRFSPKCNTDIIGPQKFQECREFFIDDGQLEINCSTSESPARDRECKKFHDKHPSLKEHHTTLQIDGLDRDCYPALSRPWCAVCIKEAKEGEPGFCKPGETLKTFDQIGTEEYDEVLAQRQDVSPSKGWGYCDEMCHADIDAKQLQEASIETISSKECKTKTEHLLEAIGRDLEPNEVPNVSLEICAAKRNVIVVPHYKLENEEYKFIENKTTEEWGGSDSCQGDSGGPLWVIKDKKAYITGIINRGQGCAKKDSYGIYARVKYHRNWILSVAASGKCT